jgi:hypothetical protein
MFREGYGGNGNHYLDGGTVLTVCKTGSQPTFAHPFAQPSNHCIEGVLLWCSAHFRTGRLQHLTREAMCV